MQFTKMHGLGNDYVYVNTLTERVDRPADVARAISDRHRGVGSDGLILIAPSSRADLRMEMYNADGSRGQMCGNGIRCVAKYAVDHGLVDGSTMRIETDAGVRSVVVESNDGRIGMVRVDMGRPSFEPSALPSTIREDRIVDYLLRVDGGAIEITCVSMGNPHAVSFGDRVEDMDLARVGRMVECAAVFPERINAHFARVDSPTHVTVRTWERGSGATQACGTGACAVVAAGAITRRMARKATVALPGGELQIDWSDDDHVYMTGPAVEVFGGDWPG